MCGLSNIFWWRDGNPDLGPIEIRPPQPLELESACQILLGFHGEKADSATAKGFIQYAGQRGIDLSQLMVAASGQNLVAACLPIFSPGKTALVMTSHASIHPAHAEAVTDCLQRVVLEMNRDQTHLVQLLLDTDDFQTAESAKKIGFTDLATLIYLQRAITRAFPEPYLPTGFRLIQYNEQNHELFARAILASYEDSLDCPALHGKREIEEIITGHKSAGEFSPDLWFAVTKDSEPVGALLLSPSAAHSTLELVYIGLAPAARGHGLGDYFMQLAFHICHRVEMKVFTLAVDSKNKPATQLYYRHGLSEVHQRLAMILEIK